MAEKGLGAHLGGHLRENGMLVALVAIVFFFTVIVRALIDVDFLSAQNITNLFLQNSYVIIMALGMLLVIVAGHIDLSVGSVAAFTGAVAAVLTVTYGLPVWVVIPTVLLVGALIGAAQGYWIAYWRIPSFIVTLAGMLVFPGLTLWLLGGRTSGRSQILPGAVDRLRAGPDRAGQAERHGDGRSGGGGAGDPVAGLAGAATRCRVRGGTRTDGPVHRPQRHRHRGADVRRLEAGQLPRIAERAGGAGGADGALRVLHRKYRGRRRIYALGGNEKAAKLSGIRTNRLAFLCFVNMGMLAALAGMIVTARLNSATPKAGTGFELDVIAAVFIGGASMTGGSGRIIGVVVGALIMGVMNNGMSILGIGIDYQQVIKGLVLLAAVIFDVYNKNK